LLHVHGIELARVPLEEVDLPVDLVLLDVDDLAGGACLAPVRVPDGALGEELEPGFVVVSFQPLIVSVVVEDVALPCVRVAAIASESGLVVVFFALLLVAPHKMSMVPS
jgi:hypothetical protein